MSEFHPLRAHGARGEASGFGGRSEAIPLGSEISYAACRVDRGGVIEGLRRGKLYQDRGILTAQPEAIKKNRPVVAGFRRPFRLRT